MPCEQWTDKISAYVDSEATGPEIEALDSHLRSCAPCAAEAFAQLKVKQLTSSAGTRYVPNRQFRERVRRQISSEPTPRRAWGWLPTLALAAAVVLVALAGLQYWRISNTPSPTLREVADLHIARLASSSPFDVASSDRHTVKPWFQGRIPFSFNLPETTNTSFTLLGGSVAYLNQSPGAHLLYEVRKHRVSVYVFQERSELRVNRPENRVLHENSFQMETWPQGGLRFYVISDVADDDVEALSKLLRTAQG